jgi:hypothetical protein
MEQMLEMELTLDCSYEEALVHEWRAEQLARLGISTDMANAVATFVDWHEVARLVALGCAPDIALEIVL